GSELSSGSPWPKWTATASTFNSTRSCPSMGASPFAARTPMRTRNPQSVASAVVTDILFLRKRFSGEPARHADPSWLETAPLEIDGGRVPVTRYFLNHPEQVLGTWSRRDTLYADGYSVKSNGVLADQLADAVARLPQFDPQAALFPTAIPSVF